MIFVYILFILVPLSIAQDIVFPSDAVRQSKNQTMEVRMKKECSINMTIVEENGEIECECVSGYLYYPPLDRCFKPYSRGPCNAGEYFILQPGKFTAECLQNPCKEGSVFYQNSCHELLKLGPPCDDEKSLVIDEKTLEISCQEVSTVLYQVIVAPIRRCSPGSKMAARGICRRIL
ncbi:uncharacterized protein [Chelonus insularis]|uniref:uncharacterized protein n=1 Tax=Chelonus insularis TaxID=460826 RepID=UPI00158AC55A|nr:uncharacterized protein LOC118067422 [Chelonus insularis]